MNNAVALAALALVGTILTIVVKPLFSLLRENTRANNKLALSMERMATSTAEVAKETKQGNVEAKERNGHLAELVLDGKSQTLEALQNIKEQHVDVQHVDQVVTGSET